MFVLCMEILLFSEEWRWQPIFSKFAKLDERNIVDEIEISPLPRLVIILTELWAPVKVLYVKEVLSNVLYTVTCCKKMDNASMSQILRCSSVVFQCSSVDCQGF